MRLLIRTLATTCAALLISNGAMAASADARNREPGPAGDLVVFDPDGRTMRSPLLRTAVETRISGFVAHVRVVQVFRNPSASPVEAIYTFPLSERAAVFAMNIKTGGRTIRGEIHERGKAREIYEAARANGLLASLLDEERPNIFTQSVANLMPGASVEIEIEYNEMLPYEAGTFTFSFPNVVGPRFSPGRDQVPDVDKISPPVTPEGTSAGHTFDIRVDIDAGIAIESVTSPLHTIEVEKRAPHLATVELTKGADVPNRDFVVRYVVGGDAVKSGVLAHRTDGDGYVSFILVPPKRVEAATAAPKEMIFVIDRSGSQSGLPLLKAKETLLWILDHMNPNDTFEIAAFSNRPEFLFGTPQLASPEMKRQARAYIFGLHAGGGTQMGEAVKAVCAKPAADGRLRIVTFMTDGYIGNDYALLGLVKELRGNSRWFPFGTGNSVNRFLLENMAKLGGGEADFVLLNDPGEKVAARFWDKISSPVLTDIQVRFEGLEVVDVLGANGGDLWAQRPLIVHARYTKPGRGRITWTGRRGVDEFSETLDVDLPSRAARNEAIPAVWARAKVDDLKERDLEGIQNGRVSPDLKRAIVEVALAHRIVTPFTSFVAVEDKVINEGGNQRTIAVPVEMPQGVSREGVFGRAELVAASSPHRRAYKSSAPMAAAIEEKDGKLDRRVRSDVDGLFDQATRRPAEPELAKPPVLSEDAQRVLADTLTRWVNGEAAKVLGLDVDAGEVKLVIRLRNTSKAVLERLEAAGLAILTVQEKTVTGRATLLDLAKLAALVEVVSIDPA